MDISVRLWERQTRLGLIAGVFLVSMAALFFVPPIPLGDGYHIFADDRRLFGIQNCLNVISNIPFMVVGVLGVAWLARPSSLRSFTAKSERLPYLIFFWGVFLTGLGSYWYHLAPSNARLPWDLLPMTCCFTSMVVALVMERISVTAGQKLLIPLLLLGIGSVAYWYLTERGGHGDYRFYLFVQFFSPVLLAAIIVFFPARYTHTSYLMIAFLLFVAAKLFELFDQQIYSWGRIISGHSLKHITAAIACYWILLMLQHRQAL